MLNTLFSMLLSCFVFFESQIVSIVIYITLYIEYFLIFRSNINIFSYTHFIKSISIHFVVNSENTNFNNCLKYMEL